ncbi:flagellar assembly protein FliW [Bacillus seohaeanensis]|jgi:flagellar assembly factor FliW|uniref:Flagellar assembly factor FliW n=1 Tax=Bacillus seohaeanensis TaxID=284580 RepID=A0ABW5RP13_9BACI
MNIETKYHGLIEIHKEEILHFINGIPGFKEEKEFVLLPLPENDWFYVLQSTKTAELGFVVTDPFLFFEDYDFTLNPSTVDQLEDPSEKNIKVLSILTVREPLHKTTTNLQAPIVINLANSKAKQIILNDTSYETKHLVFEQPQHQGQGE